MKVELRPDFEITDVVCREATGKTFEEWSDAITAEGLATKRREAIQWVYNETGRGKDVWWATTIWVEHERRLGRVQKDGRAEGYNICSTKTIAAPPATVYAAFLNGVDAWWPTATASEDGSISDGSGNVATCTRLRENKDIRYRWQTAGVDDVNDIDVTFADKGGKTALALMHNRIQTRDEADGLRRAWSEAFERLKKHLEG